MTVRELVRERFGDFSVLHRPAAGGDGPSLHFAHATGFNAETYRLLLTSLEPSLDVYAMDARGHGMSRAPADPRKLRSWAPYRKDLERFIETLSRPIVLAGHSMGGTVSLELAAGRPDLVAGLVLIDPVIVAPDRIPTLRLAQLFGMRERLLPIARGAARRRMEFPSKEDAVSNYEGRGAFKSWPRPWIEAYVDGGTTDTGYGTVRLSCDRDWESKTFAVATVDPYRSVSRVQCPVSLVAREDDGPPFNRASRATFMKCCPRARLVLLEQVSHFMVMERPEAIRAEIERMARLVRSKL